ncbi:MAG: homoserine dehydrogenase [Lachnospiraceae bacterium]|nr:homoserine dehydrogenase [Lachnospiraceae bacterium]
MVNVAVLGYGTVGSGIVEVIKENQDMVNQKAAAEIDVKYILDLRDFPGDKYEHLVVHDYEQILSDDSVDIICEAMGGVEPAYTFSKNALLKGKSVCTSNKELVAVHGPELLEIARQHNCSYLFEASVGGGIPIIRPINSSLTPEKIEAVTGILNGTTNYILTKMEKEGSDYEAVLKEAQEKGYAERNPEADIEGYDACRKIAILSSLAYGSTVNYEEVYTEGITKISTKDFKYMKELGATIKLLGMSKAEGGSCYAMVAPFVLFPSHPLYSVSDVFNGILVRGNMLGDTMYYGRGAGKLPTASAVVSDVIECARNIGRSVPCFWNPEKQALSDAADVKRRFFVRVSETDKAKIEDAFGSVEVIDAGLTDETGFITEVMCEKEYKEKAAQLTVVSMLRIEE